MGVVRSRALAALAGAIIALTVAGCGAAGGDASALQEVKSPIQLLRNAAANRVDPATIDHAISPSDTVSGCKDDAADPQHLWLTWQSSVLIYLTWAGSANMSTTRNALASSFEAQGWVQGISPAVNSIELKRPGSIATIDIYTTSRVASTKTGGQVRIDVTGPCVLTPGAASPAVRRLVAP